jgi:hypothetical protein
MQRSSIEVFFPTELTAITEGYIVKDTRFTQPPVYLNRMKGRIAKWASKREGSEQLSIQEELGIWDDAYNLGQVTYTEPQVSDLSKPSVSSGNAL